MAGLVKKEAIIKRMPQAKGLRLIEYKGDAMIGAHIVPHAKLLIDFSLEPQNGDIVVVQRDNKFTVRFFKCSEHKRWLISANRNCADMLFRDNTDIRLAVVVKVVTDTTLLRDYML